MHEYVGVEAKYGRIVDVNRHFIKRETINIERDSESGGTIELGVYRPIKISHEPHILDIPFRFYCLLPKSGTVAGGTVAGGTVALWVSGNIIHHYMSTNIFHATWLNTTRANTKE